MAQGRQGPGGCVQAKKKKNLNAAPTRACTSLMSDLQLLISPFQLAFVRLFVVLGVYYTSIIISKARQTRLALLCSAEANNREVVLGLLDKVYLSYFSFALAWLFAL